MKKNQTTKTSLKKQPAKQKAATQATASEANSEPTTLKKPPKGVTYTTSIDWEKFRHIGGAYPMPTPISLANIAVKFVVAGDQPYDAVRRAMQTLEESAALISELDCMGMNWIKREAHYTFGAGLKEVFGNERKSRAVEKIQTVLFEVAKRLTALSSEEMRRAWVYETLSGYEKNGFTDGEVKKIKRELNKPHKKNN
jgi:hypothetical protein